MKKIFWIVCILTTLSCQKQNNNLKTNKMIEKFDFEIEKKIDQIVYEIYGLSKEEIKIVEESI